jgi:hypothetical protein
MITGAANVGRTILVSPKDCNVSTTPVLTLAGKRLLFVPIS